MLKYFYNKRVLTLKKRVKELEIELKNVNDTNTLSAIYSKKDTLEQEGIFKLLLDNVNEIVTLSSSNNIIVYISPSCYTLLGYLPEEMEGKPTLAFIHPEDQPMVRELISQPNYSLSYPIKLHRLVHKDGSFIWVESQWKPIFLKYNGQQTHAVYSTKILGQINL